MNKLNFLSDLLQKLRGRLRRLKKLNYDDNGIAQLELHSELMSSEDEDGISHIPSYRKQSLTDFFVQTVDVVSLNRVGPLISTRGTPSNKLLPRVLLGNKNVTA